MQRIIIDSDAGVDDAQAIILACGHANTKIEAITSVAGNVDVEKTTANILKVLDVLEKDIPVYKGCAFPLISPPRHADFIHGKDGLGDCGVPTSKRTIEQGHAVSTILSLVNANPGELSIVALGPLTNIAMATMLDPELPSKVKELTIMGGGVTGKGNTTTTAEFNIYFDPEAARIVFQHWPLVRVLDWDTTMGTRLSKEDEDLIAAIDTPIAQFLKKINVYTEKLLTEVFNVEISSAGADALAMAVAIEPNIITKSSTHYLSVELNGEATRGMTVVDWGNRSEQEPNAEIVLEVDTKMYRDLMIAGLQQ